MLLIPGHVRCPDGPQRTVTADAGPPVAQKAQLLIGELTDNGLRLDSEFFESPQATMAERNRNTARVDSFMMRST